MASLVKNGDTYGLIWTDSSRTPKQVGESLKTTSHRKAKERKAELENKYFSFENGQREHDPWKLKWYEIAPEQHGSTESIIEAFIKFKTTTRGDQGWNEATASREIYVMRKFGRMMPRRLQDIDEDALEDFYFRPKVTSDHTRKSDYISVNTFLNWCIDKGYLTEKPQFRPKKPQTKIPKYIHPRDLSKLIAGRLSLIQQKLDDNIIQNKSQAPCWTVLGWMILAGTGMRPGELANLRLEHIHDGRIMIGEGFTTKVRAERQIPMLFETSQAISILTDPHFRSLDPPMSESSYLLGRKPNYCKTKLSKAFTDTWKEVFPDRSRRTLYNLKDMFCVRFLSDDSVPTKTGMKLNDLKEILGHSSISTTEKYLKAVPFGADLSGTIWDYPPSGST